MLSNPTERLRFVLILVLLKVLFLLLKGSFFLPLVLAGGQALPRDNLDYKTWINKDKFVSRGNSPRWEPQELFLQVLMQLRSNLNIIQFFNSIQGWARFKARFKIMEIIILYRACNKPILQIYATEIKITCGTNLLSLASRMGWPLQLQRHILPHFAQRVKRHGRRKWGRHDNGCNEKRRLLFIDLYHGRVRAYVHTCKQSVPAGRREEKSLPYSLTHTQTYSIKTEWTHSRPLWSANSNFRWLKAHQHSENRHTHAHTRTRLSAAAHFT